jgi:hypothetical protein
MPVCSADGGGTWGGIAGTLSNQTDLIAALNGKAAATSGTAVVKGNGSGGTTAAAAADIVALFGSCSGTQYLGADGACHNTSSGGGGTARTWPYYWQGAVQAGVTGFAANLPAANAPVLTNAGGTRPVAVLEWPAAQSGSYAWWTFIMPAGYTANGAITYTLETRSSDTVHQTNVYLGLACSSTLADNPTIVEAPAVGITSALRTITTGTLTPNSGGLPSCNAGDRVWINLRADTNVAGKVMTQPLDLISALFSVQGGI